MSSDSYDVVIVGGGTAGLVLAARLSEDPNLQVLVLEAGADQKDDPRVNIPAMWSTLIKSPADWVFDTVPQEPLGGRRVPFPQGRILGGSSAMNGLIFTPIPKSNVEGWAELGNPGWDWPSFSRSFSKAFRLTDGTEKSSEVTTNDGALHVSYPDRTDSEWPSIWKDTLAGLGFSVSGDLFTGKANGLVVNPESINPTTKQRSYSQNAYLTPALSRSNLAVITGAEVNRIVFEEAQSSDVVAQGVQYTKDGQTRTVQVQKEVVLAAGAIGSPMLLERSGVGSAELLQRLGIDVVVDNPHVGENLQNHVIVTVSSEVKDGLKTMDPLIRREPDALAAATEAYSKQSGPLATTGTSVTAQLPFRGIQTDEGKKELEEIFNSTLSAQIDNGKQNAEFDQAHKKFIRSVLSSPDEASGCYITLPGWGAFNPDGSRAPAPPGENNFFTIALLSTHPLSRGSVHITSASAPSPDAVAIDPGYLKHPLDIEIFARNLRLLEEILASEPLASQLKPDGRRNPSAPPRGGFADLEKARDYVKRTGLGGNHFVGSCSMLPRKLGGVVDPHLRVYGTKNLRVCDASIVPLIPRANPQAPIYGVAEHGAHIIKSDLQAQSTSP
ncbi:hypothetical protein Plec18170_005311 [Paecilomyces lecythidis]